MDDMISRKAVIDAVHTATYEFICGMEDNDELTEADKLVLSINKAICNAIKELPSAQSDMSGNMSGTHNYDALKEVVPMLIHVPSVQPVGKDINVPCKDTISRRAAIDAINHICPVDTEYDCTLLDRVDVRCVLSDLPSVQPQHELITWLLDEIWDDDAWELNCGAFPEILCRKLVKLGYVAEEGGKYVRIDQPKCGD